MAPKKNGNGKHTSMLSLEKRSDGVAVIRMDVPGESMNTLQQSFGEEFGQMFEELDQSSDVRAVVFTSGKPGSFIAGADVKMLGKVRTAHDARELSRAGQRGMDRL
ncbi:MAG TPA: enoyl-CoA hydratase-related protein, partial [Polyangiaceae bacterium]|nr:enoyl-CoA hydratase-related protein [Polyangiaceae bacterium]